MARASSFLRCAGFAAGLVCASLPAAGQASGPLAIASATLAQYEDGPQVPPSHRFLAGESVFFSFQVKGYRISPEQQVRLSYRIDVFDAGGVRLVETHSGKLEAGVTDMDKDWLPKVRHMFVIPPHAPAGVYQISAWAKDDLGGAEATIRVPMNVQGRTVEPSDKLVVRNLRFLRSESDALPLVPAIYKGGDTLWARFDVTGFKIGDKNLIDVDYGLSILSPSGRTMFSEAQAAVEKDAPFYPKRFFEGIVSLNIQPKTTPGEYTLVISVRDRLGGQSCEARQTFRIE